MLQSGLQQQCRKLIRQIHRACSNQDGSALAMHVCRFLYDGVPLFFRGQKNLFRVQFTAGGTIGGNADDGSREDFFQFAGCGFGSTRHTCHPRIAGKQFLHGRLGADLGGSGNFQPFFGFNRLVDPVLPHPSFRDTPGEFIDD